MDTVIVICDHESENLLDLAWYHDIHEVYSL